MDINADHTGGEDALGDGRQAFVRESSMSLPQTS
jgi:hypothetical protein